MPSGWTVKQCLGSVVTDGSANILAFFQYGDEFWWYNPAQDASAVSMTANTAQLAALTVPNGLKVLAIVNGFKAGVSASATLYLMPPDVNPDGRQLVERRCVRLLDLGEFRRADAGVDERRETGPRHLRRGRVFQRLDARLPRSPPAPVLNASPSSPSPACGGGRGRGLFSFSGRRGPRPPP